MSCYLFTTKWYAEILTYNETRKKLIRPILVSILVGFYSLNFKLIDSPMNII